MQSRADCFQCIRDLDARTRCLIEMNTIEPIDIKKWNFELLNCSLENDSKS